MCRCPEYVPERAATNLRLAFSRQVRGVRRSSPSSARLRAALWIWLICETAVNAHWNRQARNTITKSV
eukprot:284748-Pleurochrysis_carterae.AAC.1